MYAGIEQTGVPPPLISDLAQQQPRHRGVDTPSLLTFSAASDGDAFSVLHGAHHHHRRSVVSTKHKHSTTSHSPRQSRLLTFVPELQRICPRWLTGGFSSASGQPYSAAPQIHSINFLRKSMMLKLLHIRHCHCNTQNTGTVMG
nr:hypothetical protein CFP56_36372 [Quercus suber]